MKCRTRNSSPGSTPGCVRWGHIRRCMGLPPAPPKGQRGLVSTARHAHGTCAAARDPAYLSYHSDARHQWLPMQLVQVVSLCPQLLCDSHIPLRPPAPQPGWPQGERGDLETGESRNISHLAVLAPDCLRVQLSSWLGQGDLEASVATESRQGEGQGAPPRFHD